MTVINEGPDHVCLGHHASVHHIKGVKQELKVQINLYSVVVALWHYLRGETADPKGSSGWKSRIELRKRHWKEEILGLENMWIQICLRIWDSTRILRDHPPPPVPVISDTDSLLQHSYLYHKDWLSGEQVRQSLPLVVLPPMICEIT